MQTLSPSSIAHAVSAHFADRPALETVIRQQLATAIGDKYPTLTLDLSRTQLARPQRRGWLLQPFMPVVHDALASGVPLDFREVDSLPWYLSDEPPKRLKLPGLTREKLDMQVIAALVGELPQILPIALQNALAEYWDAGHWRWLAHVLTDTLRVGALRQAGLDEQTRETIDQLVTLPEREARIARHGQDAVYAYGLEATLKSGAQSVSLLGPELVLLRAVNGKPPVLLCSPGGNVEVFASTDALIQAFGQRLGEQYVADDILVQRYEPDGDIFEHQGAMILNRQLEELGHLRLPTAQPFSTWQTLYADLTDPGRFFLDLPAAPIQSLDTLRQHLPTWLQRASADDQATYRRYAMALASAKQRGGGRHFLSDIDDIRTFTVKSLLQTLQHDAVTFGSQIATPPSVAALHPNDLQLTFTVAAGYPGTVGIIHHERMSLTDLAINNLASRPSGTVTLANRHGLALPSWLTADYLMGTNGLIERVDIGQHYPRLLEEHLLGESPEARQREALFADQQTLQLPLLALELCLQQQSGLSPLGARRVAALMAHDASDQRVDNHQVVIRHLALLRAPGAEPDQVSGMYLIESQNADVGPHLLYRPLYAPALQEFTSRQALFDAIVQAGDLQDSVLTWLSDSARPIYAHGGFQEPHYVRFGQGDEFAPLSIPAPASLAADGINDELQQCLVTGRLMAYLFSDHARALVEQANRDSVSNSESRWQVLLEGSSLLFGNLLLPLLRGPAMLTGWLFGLMTSLGQDIPGLIADDPKTRELAAVDLLLNLGMLLLEAVPRVTSPHPPLPQGLKERALPSSLAARITEQWPVPRPPTIREGAVTLPGVMPDANNTVLDFSFSQARHRLTAAQRTRLSHYQAIRPTPLPQPILNGPRRGLYWVDNNWYALVDSQWLQVTLEPEGDIRVIAPQDPHRSGPYLRSDAEGVWTVDTRLRLRGGMPPKRIAAERQRKAQRIQQLNAQYEQFSLQYARTMIVTRAKVAEMNNSELDLTLNDSQRAKIRQDTERVLREETESFLPLLDSLKERAELGIPMIQSMVVSLLVNSIANARSLLVIAEGDRQALYRSQPQFTPRNPNFSRSMLSNPAGYRQFLNQVMMINDRSIGWLELKDRHLNDLYGRGSSGRQKYLELTRDRPNEITALAVKELQIHVIKLQTFEELTQQTFKIKEAFNSLLDPLHEHVRTHAEFNALELTADERLSVLESLVEHYGRALDGLQGLGIISASEVKSEYFGKLMALIEGLYQDVTVQLASEIKPLEEAPVRPPKRSPVAPDRPQRRVIKTERKGTLIGEFKPASTSLPIDVVEVRSEDTNQVLGTYAQRGDEWNEFITVRPPEPGPAPRAVSLLKGEARKLLARLEQHLLRGEDYKKVCRHPEEVQEILDFESTRYDKLATELDRAIEATPANTRVEADQKLVDDMRRGAAQLSEKGRTLRVQLCLQLPPTHGNIEYLISQKRVNMARLGERIQLSGTRKDFVQEYAINDEKGYPLWYAHFHYPQASTPKHQYTVAHLKTREQRRVGYYTLLAAAQSPQAIVNVHRGLIGKKLAERWFLPLAP